MTAADRLAAAGWTRRSAASEPRLSELVETYRELGLEVTLAPGSAGDGCTACYPADDAPGAVRIIYTRPRSGGRGEGR